MRLPRGLVGALAVLVIVAACSDAGGDEVARSEATTTDTASVDAADGEMTALPLRDGPRKETTNGVPHVQLDAEPVPEIDAELRRRAFLLPDVEDRASVLSLPGAIGLWLTSDVELARPEVLGGNREFAHIHPDGSLHVWLPVERALEVEQTKWGELHPWVDRDGFWDGVVMVYTPETLDEVDVAMRIIVDAYNFVTGTDLDPLAFE
ncbi:MAG: luciferase family protein [Acidimicrobiia bacterium]